MPPEGARPFRGAFFVFFQEQNEPPEARNPSKPRIPPAEFGGCAALQSTIFFVTLEVFMPQKSLEHQMPSEDSIVTAPEG